MTGPIDSTSAARAAFTEHPRFAYRGCAPDVVLPSRMAGDLDLPVGAHQAPDVDGGESQAVRVAREAAAVEVCLGCAVMVQCGAYANSITAEGKLAEPDGVWGGLRALERHRAFIKTRHEVAPVVPDTRFATPQKRAVMRALAAHTDAYAVAAAAGMDVRTANWQRSQLTRLLGLPHDASRAQFLAAAAERGLLEGVAVVADDGSVPAVPPPTRMPDPVPEPAPAAAVVVAMVEAADGEPDGPGARLRLRSPRRDRFADIEGQLALWEAELTELAPVHDLFTATPLEAAA